MKIIIALLGALLISGVVYFIYDSRTSVESIEVQIQEDAETQESAEKITEPPPQQDTFPAATEMDIIVSTPVSKTTATAPVVNISNDTEIIFSIDDTDAELHAYDASGLHTGFSRDSSGKIVGVDEEINGARTLIFGAYAFIYYPTDINGYIELRAKRSQRTALLVHFGEEQYYYELPLEKDSIAQVPIRFSEDDRIDVGPMKFDSDGDGIFEKTISGKQ